MNLKQTLNYKWYRFKYNYAPYMQLRTPVDVSLELASICNQRCGYCYHSDQEGLPFAKGLMKYELAQSIIEQAAELGVNSLKYNYRGESTLHPDFYRIAWGAKNLA